MKKKALITGISGQDGAYLAQLLLSKGYEVHGTSRSKGEDTFLNLRKIGILDKVSLHCLLPTDFSSVLSLLQQTEFTEIYNLSGQSSVGLSYIRPVETFESILLATLNLLEGLRQLKLPARLYNAGSSECFGDTPTPANEQTAFRPCSPYASAKTASHFAVANYREAYGIFAATGILFNHESPLRPSRFVTQKIISTAVRISRGSNERLELGNLDIERDWGWAPEYVEAMWRILQQDNPEDFVIATGEICSLRQFVGHVFAVLGLNATDHVISNDTLRRPSDIGRSVGEPAKAMSILGWKAQTHVQALIEKLIHNYESGSIC